MITSRSARSGAMAKLNRFFPILGLLGVFMVMSAVAQAPPKTKPHLEMQLQSIQDDGVFLEAGGLVVMEAESVTLPDNWVIEAIDPDYRGIGYIRYDGPNLYSGPNENKVFAYTFLIEHEGIYRMRMRMQHLGAPEDDLWNDCWVKLNDGDWVKAFHPKSRWLENFGFYSFFEILDPPPAQIVDPEFDLTAGLHTLYISGRSENLRIDRIHFWKKEDPFKVTFDNGTDPDQPESERDGTTFEPSFLEADPDEVIWSVEPIGTDFNSVSITLTSNGSADLNVSDISLEGTNPDEFSVSSGGGFTVDAGESETITVDFDPSTAGNKLATVVIEHDGINSPVGVSLSGSATTGGEGNQVLFRVNAGGPEILDGENVPWAEDQTHDDTHANGAADAGNPSPFVNSSATGDWTFGRDETISFHSSVPAETPAELFQRGRWDPSNDPMMQWDIPIEEGKEVELRLYFSEQLFEGEDSPSGIGWPRLFDVYIDDVLTLDDFHIFDEAGHDTGLMKSFTFISDGNIDVDLDNVNHDPIIQAVEVLEVGGITQALGTGWNLVGLPTSPADAGYMNVFGDVSPDLEPFYWDGGAYATSTTVENGIGYWLSVGTAGEVVFPGGSVSSITRDLEDGWNLISGPACGMPLASVSDPSNILIGGTLFGYDGGYVNAEDMIPGNGYWIQTTGSGSITMDCSAVSKGNTALTMPNTDAFGWLEIKDDARHVQRLLFGQDLSEGDLKHFAMPPRSSYNAFDARFAGDSRLLEGGFGTIELQADHFPVRVALRALPEGYDNGVVVEEWKDGESVRRYTLAIGEEVMITDAAVTMLKLGSTALDGLETPEQFNLQGNYPNPFNPTTSVVFDLPASGQVQVKVFDMLGREMLSTPMTQVEAGTGRQISLDAGSLASGMYIYTVTARVEGQTLVQTGRMTLLK